MKKIIAAFDGLKYSASTRDHAIALTQLTGYHLVGVFLAAWMILNIYLLQRSFDPYPFIFLNLLLSTVAALQAPVIMMSQNRKEEKDRKRAVNDYLINLKAEMEVRNLHRKGDLLMTEQMQTLFSIQQTQVELMEEIKSLMPARPNQE